MTKKTVSQTGFAFKLDQSVDNFYVGLPSLIAQVVPTLLAVVRANKKTGPAPWDSNPYSIQEKISFNNLNSYVDIINDYGSWGSALEQIYEEIEASDAGIKTDILESFKDRYVLIKAEIIGESSLPKSSVEQKFEIIKQNSDEIITRVTRSLRQDLSNASGSGTALHIEHIDKVCLIFVCHAFLSCKILEKPV